MARLKVFSTQGDGSDMGEIGEVDDSELTYSGGTAHLESPGSEQLLNLICKGFSGGFGERVFDLAKGERLLKGCRVTGYGGRVKIDYMSVGRR